MRSTTHDTVPEDLRRAIAKNSRAQKTFTTLSRANLFSLTYRTNHMRTPAGRERKIAELVALLARGETIQPQAAPRPQAGAPKAQRTPKAAPRPRKERNA
jgi:uncharacterized protein YdeI (YjbR/CyaY-like superfamily)